MLNLFRMKESNKSNLNQGNIYWPLGHREIGLIALKIIVYFDTNELSFRCCHALTPNR